MLLLPSISHGLIGILVISFLAISLIIPAAFADDSPQTWKIKIMKGASDSNPSHVFFPDELPISIGDTVEWVNTDDVTHSIASGISDYPDYFGHFFHPGNVESGQTVSFTLSDTEQLAFYYLCEIHPWMKGKLFVSENSVAQPETESPISTEKNSYKSGEVISVSGSVHEDFWGTDYQLLVFDQENNLVEASYGYFDDNAHYTEVINPEKTNWENEGQYQLKLVYGLPSKVAKTTFEYSNSELVEVPTWVKNVGEFWCDDQIKDEEFVNAIQNLIERKIINVDGNNFSSSSNHHIPEWIKNNTCWWADGQISDADFLSGIEFLINKGTIRL